MQVADSAHIPPCFGTSLAPQFRWQPLSYRVNDMTKRILKTVLVFAWFGIPSACLAQAVHADDVEIIGPPHVKPAPDEKKPDLAAAEKIIIDRTNEFREKEGNPRVEVNPKLTETARYFADYMAKTDRYGHTADGSRPADRAAKHGYEHCIVAENIAYRYNSSGFSTDELGTHFFTGWRESPGHRKNMLDPDVTETGVAIARSEKTGYYYAVQLFGRPKSKAIEFHIKNRTEAAVNYRIGEESFALEPGYTRTHLRCRPSDVILEASDKKPDSKQTSQPVRPGPGDRLSVVNEGQQIRLKKE
jgi:uncharacterized protein YkwD